MKVDITIFDSNFPHQKYLTPHVVSSKINWVRDGVRRKINVYTDNFIKKEVIDVPKDGNLNICVLLEPYTNPAWTDVYDYIQTDFEKFDLIITHNLSKLGDLIKTRADKFYYSNKCHTTTFLEPKDIGIIEKKGFISHVFSDKTMAEGHKLRHLIHTKYKDSGIMDFFGSGTGNPNGDLRNYGLVNYKYSICCENTLQYGYNSEKLNDCFLTGTIPIYWGNHIFNNPYDRDGMFFFSPLYTEVVDFDFNESLQSLEDVLKYILENDPYDQLMESIKHNFYLTLENFQTEDNIYDIIKEKFYDYLA